jgi:hypothetical protein
MPLNDTPNQQVTLPPPPPTLPPWAKVLWYIAETVAIGISWKLFDYGQAMKAIGLGTDSEAPDEWRRFQVRWADQVSQDAADDQMFTIDVVNYTNGAIDSTWNDTDHTQVLTAINNLLTGIASSTSNRYTCQEVKGYRMAYNPLSNVKPFAESGPPVASSAPNVTGSGGSASSPQVCSTVTERTPVRANWGRAYMPCLGSSQIDTNGRLLAACRIAYGAAWQAFVEELGANQFHLVVPSTQSNKVPLRALQAVTAVSVDDVIDSHHRRRHKHALAHTIHPVTTQLLPAENAST